MSSQVLSKPWMKSVGTAALCFVAVIAGLAAGNAILNPHETVIRTKPASGHDLPRMILAPGDLFPYEPIRYAEGTPGNFEDLLGKGNAIFYFIEPHCIPCNNMLSFRRDAMRQRLAPGVSEIIVVPDTPEFRPDDYTDLFKGTRVVLYDRPYWEKTYHQVMWPTIVGVDESGFISHIQYGYENAIDYELVERFFSPVE